MVDSTLIKRICDYAEVSKKDTVLEIGAGTGNLTEELLERAKKVYAIEKDPDFIKILNEKFSKNKNIKIMQGDAVKIEFPKFDKIVSNLPYSISRKITKKILMCRFKGGILVYQREFANKLVAQPRSENYRFISALAQSAADVEILEDIPPSAFEPAPNVHSSIVKLKIKNKIDEKYANFLNNLFNHKNKILKNICVDKKIPKKFSCKRPIDLKPEELRKIYLSL